MTGSIYLVGVLSFGFVPHPLCKIRLSGNGGDGWKGSVA